MQNDDELLTRTETAKILKVELTTLWCWTKKEKITAYDIGNFVYYKREEIMKLKVTLNH